MSMVGAFVSTKYLNNMLKPQAKLTDVELQRLIQLIRVTQWNFKLDTYETEALKEILKSVQKVRREINAKLKRVKSTSEFTRERLNALADEMQHLTAAVQAQITKQITQVSTAAGVASYAKHNDILSFGGRVPNFNPVSLSAAQLRSMVTETPIGGHLLSEWATKAFDASLQDTIKTEIMAGMMQGESYRSLVKRFDDVAFPRLERNTETLVRSYVQSVNVQASKDIANANKDLVKGWKWNSVCENRTCCQCLSLDSKDIIYPLDGGPEIPIHPRGRCFPEMVTKTFRELGMDVDEIRTAYRPYTIRGNIDAATGKITTAKVGTGGGRIISTGRFLGTYEDYFKIQSKAVQIQILGPGRYELWEKGMPLSNLTDKNGRLRLLKELQ